MKIITVLTLVFLFLSCNDRKNAANSKKIAEPTVLSQMSDVSGINKPDVTPLIEKNTYGIIEYPVFINDRHSESINSIIFEEVKRINNANAPQDELAIQYKITKMDNKYISIVFDGLVIVAGTAHPYRVVSTLIIDRETGDRLRLKDVVDINNVFLKQVYADEKRVLAEKGIDNDVDSVNYFPLDKILKEADAGNSQVKTYLTDGFIVMRIEVAHAIGDYIDVPVSLENISDIQTEGEKERMEIKSYAVVVGYQKLEAKARRLYQPRVRSAAPQH